MSERLEEIKEDLIDEEFMSAGTALWLINRVEELEDEIYQDPRQGMLEDLHMENERLEKRVEELENQYDEQLEESQKTYDYFKNEINRYKQALEEIRSEASGYMSNSAAQRLYDIANEALEGEE